MLFGSTQKQKGMMGDRKYDSVVKVQDELRFPFLTFLKTCIDLVKVSQPQFLQLHNRDNYVHHQVFQDSQKEGSI